MIDLETILRAVSAFTPAVAQLPAVKRLIDAGVSMLAEKDQAVAQAAYSDLIADNADGHRRLQDKLAEAAKR